jgi:YVTN family beta-propeller protein
MPDLKYLGEVKVGLVPDWITFTPDSKKLYVANAHDNNVTVIDVPGRKVITTIKVGQIPKRNSTGIFPVIGTGTGTN